MNRHVKKPANKPAKRSASRAKATRSSKAAVTRRRGGRAGTLGPAEGDSPVRAYIASLSAWQRALAQRFDDLMTREVPGVKRAIKWSLPFYGVKDQGWFVSCGAFAKSVKVTFFHGVSLQPVPPSGAGKQLRGIDLRSAEEFDEIQLASWVRQAAKLPGMGS